MSERTTGSGLVLVEKRAAEVPNGNVPPDSDPGTVGPPTAVPGDPHGVYIKPSAWSGWPDEWATPLWGGSAMEYLVDTAWCCLDINASVVASMPAYLVGASASTQASWMTNPDPDLYTGWTEFSKQLMWDFQMGEAFVLATARYDNGNGWPARFHVVPPWMVSAEIKADGLRHYKIGNHDPGPDLLHLRYKSTTGDARGHGALEAGRSRLVAAAVLQRYAATLAQGGGVPTFVITHPEELDATQAKDLQQAWWESRIASLGLPAVFSGGIDIKTLSFSPKDMMLLELAQWNETRIAVLLGVPPAIVALPSNSDSLTYSTALSAREQHWQIGLKPKVAPVMEALSGWLLPRGVAVELNRDEYLRPGPLERAQTLEILLRSNVISLAEAQEQERLGGAAAPSDTLTSGVLQ